MVSNDAGTERIKYEPSPNDRLGYCVNENGVEEVGLTYQGELNKVSQRSRRIVFLDIRAKG